VLRQRAGFDGVAQLSGVRVQVRLRRAQIGVTEEFGDHVEARRLRRFGSEGVAQHVGGHRYANVSAQSGEQLVERVQLHGLTERLTIKIDQHEIGVTGLSTGP